MPGWANTLHVTHTMPYTELTMERATLDDLPLCADAANCGEKILSVSISLLVVRLMNRGEVRATERLIRFWSRAKVGLLRD